MWVKVVASGLVHGRGDHIVDTAAVKHYLLGSRGARQGTRRKWLAYISPVGWRYANQKMPRLGGDKLSAPPA